jgi:hypothetical protein
MLSRDDSNQSETDQPLGLEWLNEQVWPEEEDVDDFLAWLRDSRRSDKHNSIRSNKRVR